MTIVERENVIRNTRIGMTINSRNNGMNALLMPLKKTV